MANSADHPKKVFIKRVIELEVRLSYHDRVKGTIPDALLEAGVMPEDAPGPEYAYEDSGSLFSLNSRLFS